MSEEAKSGAPGMVRSARALVVAGVLLLGLPGGCVSRADEGTTGGTGGVDGVSGGHGAISSCLAAGTRVTTPDGARRIEELEVGELVVSLDHETGRIRYNPITAIRSARRSVGEVRVHGRRLLSTEEHPFFDASKGRYVEGATIDGDTALVTLPHPDAPAQLRTDEVLGSFMAEAYVPSVAEAEVYDLTVERDHNYFAEGVLVHNKSGGSPPVPPGVCTHALASTAVVVCSGSLEAAFASSAVDPVWVTWLESDEPNSGLGGAGGADSDQDAIVVAFEVCSTSYGFPNWDPAFSPFVQPHQEVKVGVSHTGPCTSPSMTPTVANEAGAVGVGTGWVHVEIPVDEFECLYLATDADFGYCP